MAKSVGILCLVLFLCVPLVGLADGPESYAAIVRWAGCHVTLYEDPGTDITGSFFGIVMGTGEPAVVIGTAPDDSIPYYGGLMILFHEVGHCLQWQEGTLNASYDRKTTELDADRRAADLACDYGLDGRRHLHDLFVWAHDKYDYDGDVNHGTLAERIHQGALATHCDRVQQAA